MFLIVRMLPLMLFLFVVVLGAHFIAVAWPIILLAAAVGVLIKVLK
jgi:hypothetical protein